MWGQTPIGRSVGDYIARRAPALQVHDDTVFLADWADRPRLKPAAHRRRYALDLSLPFASAAEVSPALHTHDPNSPDRICRRCDQNTGNYPITLLD